jgi:methylmalonyl-CoA mutase
MKVLFDGIPLNKMSVSMTMNGAVLPILAFYINAGLEQGAKLEEMAGTIQNDILKEFMVRNTYIYPPKFSMKIIADIFEFTSKKMPKFNSISISGYHMQEAGATADIELAYTPGRRTRIPTCRGECRYGYRLFRSAFVVFLGHWYEPLHGNCQDACSTFVVGKNRETIQSEESKIAGTCVHTRKLRDGRSPSRILSIMLDVPASKPWEQHWVIPSRCTPMRSMKLLHCQPISRHVLPVTPRFIFSRKQKFVVRLTHGQVHIMLNRSPTTWLKKHGHLIEEVEKLGGMAAAIETGIPKMRIEEAAARTQARIDSGAQTIVGVNKYRLEKEDPIDILEVDNTAVRAQQIERLKQLRANATRLMYRKHWLPLPNVHVQATVTCSSWLWKQQELELLWEKFRMPAKQYQDVIKQPSEQFQACIHQKPKTMQAFRKLVS